MCYLCTAAHSTSLISRYVAETLQNKPIFVYLNETKQTEAIVKEDDAFLFISCRIDIFTLLIFDGHG